jgi:hypothetical protein
LIEHFINRLDSRLRLAASWASSGSTYIIPPGTQAVNSAAPEIESRAAVLRARCLFYVESISALGRHPRFIHCREYPFADHRRFLTRAPPHSLLVIDTNRRKIPLCLSISPHLHFDRLPESSTRAGKTSPAPLVGSSNAFLPSNIINP